MLLLSALALAWLAQPVRAQSAADLQAAGEAFQQGQRAQVQGDFAQAAELFDLAHHTAPSAGALRSALRMHQSAGHHATAAMRAAEALASYPDDAATVALANEVLAAETPLVARLDISCATPCALTLDARVASADATHLTLYVEPGPHVVRASWGRRTLERALDTRAGATDTLALDESEVPAVGTAESPAESPTDATPHAPLPPPAVASSTSEGLSPLFVAIAGGLTLVAAGTAIGVGVDMLAARDRYVAAPTEAGWRDGVGRETATNALLGTAIGLAAVSVALAIVTDWDGASTTDEAQARGPRLELAASPTGAFGQLTLSL